MNDETTVLPKLTNETEAERLTQQRNRGITIGVAIAIVAAMICFGGIAIGAFLMRVLVL